MNDFPEIDVVYLDNAATSLTPLVVINKITEYYTKYNANVHRGIHKLSVKASEEYEAVRGKIADFINAEEREIVFTKGTTESLNLLAYTLTKNLKEGDEVLLSLMEHHANIVPWQQIAKEKGFSLKFVGIKDGKIDIEDLKNKLSNKTKIVSVIHASNVLGCVNDVKLIAKLAHEKNALCIVDGAQSIPHLKIDVKDLDCDFFVFASHKMCGPTGVGALYGKASLLEEMPPFLYGGDMIAKVTLEESTWNEIPLKFEAGTPNIAGVIGFGAAIDFMKNKKDNPELIKYGIEQLKKIEGLTLYNVEENNIGILSFNLEGIHPHDLSTLLDRESIAIRGGHHCAMPLMKYLNINGCGRASLFFYNKKEEIDKLVNALEKAKKVFENG